MGKYWEYSRKEVRKYCNNKWRIRGKYHKKYLERTVKVQVMYVKSSVESVYKEMEKYNGGTKKVTDNFWESTGKFKAITGSREIPGSIWRVPRKERKVQRNTRTVPGTFSERTIKVLEKYWESTRNILGKYPLTPLLHPCNTSVTLL